MPEEVVRGVDALRAYLQRIAFRQLYKFIAGSNHYGVLPSVVNRTSAAGVEHFFATVLRGCPGLELAQCLLTGRPAERDQLSDADRATADLLAAAELLRAEDGRILPADLQLINAFGSDLLVDRRIHFPAGSLHEVYVGFDSYLMLYYLDLAEVQREHRAVDLCTGSGIAALHLAQRCDHVLATDIGPVPLRLVQINRRLNAKEGILTVRNQPLDETLDGSERFDVLTCNPPFVAYPPGFGATLYSQGTEVDGLGYMRTILDRLPEVLTPGGCAYLVADLVGGLHGPHFVHELRQRARADGLAIDVYIDGVVDAEDQVPAFTAHMAAANPQRDRQELAAELRRFQREELRAERYYLSTLRVQTDRQPGLRLLRRYALPEGAKGETWPEILLS